MAAQIRANTGSSDGLLSSDTQTIIKTNIDLCHSPEYKLHRKCSSYLLFDMRLKMATLRLQARLSGTNELRSDTMLHSA